LVAEGFGLLARVFEAVGFFAEVLGFALDTVAFLAGATLALFTVVEDFVLPISV
jgi:hypothetical protein